MTSSVVNLSFSFANPLLAAICVAVATPIRADVISGRVVDAQGAPVTGVRVALAQLKLNATTGADGLFSITTPSVSLADRHGVNPGFTLSDRGLHLRLQGDQEVLVEVLSVDGRRLASLFRGRLAAGDQVLPLRDWQRGLPTGVHILSVEANGYRASTRLATSGSLGLPGGASRAFLAKPAAAAPDTLLLTKNAWFPKKSPLPSTATQALGDVTMVKDPIWVNNPTQDKYNSIIVGAVDRRNDAPMYLIVKAMIVI
jgi:hypothetical protein